MTTSASGDIVIDLGMWLRFLLRSLHFASDSGNLVLREKPIILPWYLHTWLPPELLVKHSFCLSEKLLVKNWLAKMIKKYKARSCFLPPVTQGKVSFLHV